MCGFTFTDDAYLALFELMKRAYDVELFFLYKSRYAGIVCKRG